MQYRVEFLLDGKLLTFEEIPFKPESGQRVIVREQNYTILDVCYNVTDKNYVVHLVAIKDDGSFIF